MTKDDLRELGEIMGDKPIEGITLGAELIRWYRLHQRLLERHVEVVEERDRLKRRVGYKAKRRNRSREAELLRALHAKEVALDFAIRRNEVLRRQVNA